MALAFLIGRIVFGLYWLEVAYAHFFKADGLVGYASSKSCKSPKLAVAFTGILALLGGLSILLGAWTATGVVLLVVFLLGVSFKMHAYWKVQDPMAKMGDRVNFMKNMALIGALLMMLAIAQPWAYSLGF